MGRPMAQRVIIATIALGGQYPRGVARMIERFHSHSPGYEIMAWINALPHCAPANVIEAGYDYTAYCAKPFALYEAFAAGADIGMLLDANFYPIRPITPLVTHIHQHGYYFCQNGARVGEWCSDRALKGLAITRENAMELEEISSYCVGLNFADSRCRELLRRWMDISLDRETVPGPHSNRAFFGTEQFARNPGWCSDDPRVRGHRHDQTVLSVLAHRLISPLELTARPMFTTYAGHERDVTVLVDDGRIS